MGTKQLTSLHTIVKLRSELELSLVRAGEIPRSSDPAQRPCSCLQIVYQNEAPTNGNWKIFFVAFKTASIALQRDDKLQGNLRFTVSSRVKTAIGTDGRLTIEVEVGRGGRRREDMVLTS